MALRFNAPSFARPAAPSLALAIALASAPFAREARAADPTTADCISAAEASVKLRGEHKLREARAELLVCAARNCPADVRAECTRKVELVNTAIPTIVFETKDASGNDVTGVSVRMDGKKLVDRLEGTAISLDPGEHNFTFEAAGMPPVDRTFVLHEGEKERRERIVLGATVGTAAAPATSTSTGLATGSAGGDDGQTRRTIGLVVGGVGLASLAVGAVFGLTASSKWSDSKDACASATVCSNHAQAVSDHDSASSLATVSTITFIAGAAAVAAGAVLYFTAPRGEHPEAALHLAPTIVPGGAGFSLGGAL